MVFILSFDVGIKNLAFCYSFNENIIRWNILNIQGDTLNMTCERCIVLLDETFKDDVIDHVLIENQPVQKNPTMKTIQIMVYAYFVQRKVLVGTVNSPILGIHFISASRKNKYTTKFNIDIECKTKYQKNKKQAIACTQKLLEESFWLSYFMKHKKKDDLADSYLQTLSYIDYEPVLPNPPDPLEVGDNSSTSSTSH